MVHKRYYFDTCVGAALVLTIAACAGEASTPIADARSDVGAREDGPWAFDGPRPERTSDSAPPLSDGAPRTPDGAPPFQGTFPPAKAGFSNATLSVAGEERRVVLHLPAALPAKAPLVIVLHGTDGNAQDTVWAMNADELSDAEKVVIAAPQARVMTKGDWDDHEAGQVYWESYPNIGSSTNPDLLLVRAIIAEAARVYDVDERRVYTMGFSGGAFFSLLCATAMPDRVAGFAEMSGGLVRCETMGACSFRGSGSSCDVLATQPGYCACSLSEKPGPLSAAGRKPPGYLVHAADDDVVSSYYTCQLAARMEQLGYPHSVTITPSGGHELIQSFAQKAWAYLSAFQLP